MTFNLFVLPFILGLIFLVVVLVKKNRQWIRLMSTDDRKKLKGWYRSPKILLALKEIFFESLLHRKMFRRNPLLGYMHMSFAFGWFLLILFGNMESRIYSGLWVNPPYYPIFLKFFIHDKHVLPFEIFTVPGFFRFSMDLLLMFVLSGLVLAIIKRSRSKWFGLTKTTQHHFTDKVAITCLWLIFPMRLLAECMTAGAYGYGGGFITQHVGNVLAFLWPLNDKSIAYGFWWFYSLSLGIFFVTLPYSRYMHIPTEVMLIIYRNFGIKAGKEQSPIHEIEIQSCPKCGVCIDICQMNTAAGINDIQAVYFLQSVRNQQVIDGLVNRCLVCGRCEEVCPVGIHTDNQRISQRNSFVQLQKQDYSYLNHEADPQKAELIYFAGCMSHLTPAIPRAMTKILDAAGVNYLFLDEDRSVCCGRPMMLAGKLKQAEELIERNKKSITGSGAKTLVTSCPICYRVFREEYGLDIRVLHHTQYLLELIKKGKLPLQTYFRKVAYHDPCDLGRGSGILNEPRELVRKIADPVAVRDEAKDAPCCGGSLGLLNADRHERDLITKEALANYLDKDAELLVTACPLCKKTFAKHSPLEVVDVAELVAAAIPKVEKETGELVN
ncbi:MAG: (Fe-S)-binding protein [Bacteroidetes bacterium]|nr:(Fe-S)-binding protein [Bacteroidota bacterium]